MKLTLARKIFCAAALVCAAAWNANAVNLVANPGFESGSFSGWNHTGDANGFDNVGSNPAFAHSGTYHANLGSNPDLGGLAQNLSTVAGTAYTLSFWLAYDVTVDPNDPNLTPNAVFEVYFNNALVFHIDNTTAGAPFDYKLFAFTVVATSGTSNLQIVYQHGNDFWRLDDVAVQVPETASTIWLALPTFAALGLLYSRKGRKGLAQA